MVKKVKKSSLKKKNNISKADTDGSPKVSPKPKSLKAVKAEDGKAPPEEDVTSGKTARKVQHKAPKAESVESVKSSEKDKAALAAEAAEEILKKIAVPDAQKSGAFVLSNWHLKYKDVLGQYKKFVKSCDKLQVIEQDNGKYIIQRAGDKTKPPPLQSGKDVANMKKDWKQLLLSAWNVYSQATPAQERNVEVFISALPRGVRHMKPETEAGKDPAASEKAVPKAVPKPEKAGKKQKKNVKDVKVKVKLTKKVAKGKKKA
ncbi:Putative 149 kDa protein [Durusdinium trenchii]|uniref:149 kDa protein n=1 Tax=Durusdinium trenchii TaxID=1381693 RepID=A0ABP0S383_9DINO